METSSKYLPFDMEGLTPEMVWKAEVELGETPDVRSECIKEMRRMINGERDFRPLMDEKFLLRFLRARKFDVKKAFAALTNFYTFKVRYSRILTDFTPTELEHVYDMNCLHILPYRDKDGAPVGIGRIEDFDLDKASVDELVSAALVGAELGLDSEATQICGASIILDLKGLSLRFMKHVSSPRFLYRIIRALQDCLPVRVKAFHILNAPFFFNVIFSIVRRFLSEKMSKRFQFHGGNLQSLHKQLPPEILPKEVGGLLGPMDCSDLKKKICTQDAHYQRINKYGFQEKRAQFIRKKSSMALGLFM